MRVPGPLGRTGVVVAALMALLNAYAIAPEHSLAFAPVVIAALLVASYTRTLALRTASRELNNLLGGANAG